MNGTSEKQSNLWRDLVDLVGMIIGVIVLALTALAAVMIYQGLVFYMLWSWFVVPFGAVQITVPWACGLILTSMALSQGVRYTAWEVLKEIGTVGVITLTKTGVPNEFDFRLSNRLIEFAKKKCSESMWISLSRPALALTVGWLIHLFM